MYKGYQSERAFYNAKLHGLAVVIVGEQYASDYLTNEVSNTICKRPFTTEQFPEPRVTNLTDQEAKNLYFELLNTCRKVKANQKETNKLLNVSTSVMSDQQRSKLIRIMKWKFHWSAEVSFSKIVEICPELTKRLTPWQIKNTKLLPLFAQITMKQADRIIKRLEKIEERNESK